MLWLDTALELWRSLWKIAWLRVDARQRKSLRDNSKAPSSRSTPKDEWLDAISADQTLSELVHQRALQFAREWK